LRLRKRVREVISKGRTRKKESRRRRRRFSARRRPAAAKKKERHAAPSLTPSLSFASVK